MRVHVFANWDRYYVGGNMIVVSKRFIAKGEEVSNNYGVHYTQVY